MCCRVVVCEKEPATSELGAGERRKEPESVQRAMMMMMLTTWHFLPPWSGGRGGRRSLEQLKDTRDNQKRVTQPRLRHTLGRWNGGPCLCFEHTIFILARARDEIARPMRALALIIFSQPLPVHPSDGLASQATKKNCNNNNI